MTQTYDEIKKEFIQWCNEDPALELANGVGTFENIADWFLPKLHTLQEEYKIIKVEIGIDLGID